MIKTGITSRMTSSWWCFHAKKCRENPVIKDRQLFMSENINEFGDFGIGLTIKYSSMSCVRTGNSEILNSEK